MNSLNVSPLLDRYAWSYTVLARSREILSRFDRSPLAARRTTPRTVAASILYVTGKLVDQKREQKQIARNLGVDVASISHLHAKLIRELHLRSQ